MKKIAVALVIVFGIAAIIGILADSNTSDVSTESTSQSEATTTMEDASNTDDSTFVSDDDATVSEDNEQPTDLEKTPEDTTPTAPSFTATEVAAHNSVVDCWTYIDGSVYDLTSYIPRHPGGESVLEACGGDGTSLFNERKTTDGSTVGSGTEHSDNARAQLSDFQVGTLAN